MRNDSAKTQKASEATEISISAAVADSADVFALNVMLHNIHSFVQHTVRQGDRQRLTQKEKQTGTGTKTKTKTKEQSCLVSDQRVVE